MNEFSASSTRKLESSHWLLQKLMYKVAETENCTILFGHRDKQYQFDLFTKGRELIGGQWVVVDKDSVVTNCDGYINESYHNYEEDGKPCSLALDVAPYINGSVQMDARTVAFFAGKVMLRAQLMGIPITWGGDWDGDKDTTDNTLNDYYHFQLKGVK